MRWLALFLLVKMSPGLAAPWSQPGPPSELCRAASAAAERAAGIPDRLMHAIGVVESGRRDPAGVVAPWPWTINAEGVGSYFATKTEALAAVNALRARGVRSIDVGCMQVNLFHHADAFASLDEAFDPFVNARYAASFLKRLLAQTGSWPAATAGYHSLTPELGEPYARRVLAILNGLEQRPQQGTQPIAFASAPPGFLRSSQGWAGTSLYSAAAGATFGSTSTARIIRLPGAASPAGGVTLIAGAVPPGRGLDAYRASPVPLATRMLSKPG